MKFFGVFFLTVATLASGLRAQEVWTAAASPIGQNLWSVAGGAGLFVAVGENGTLVTSPDGAVWTPRASGTTSWLVGATFANHQFVVVGDQGLLLTSPDGLVWTQRPSGTGERLNAVAFGRDRWLAVGENGSAVTSADGLNWTAVPPSAFGWTSALTGWLRGFCFASGSFVGAGQRGHIVTTADANYFAAHSVATAADLEGVTYARHRFVAVGAGGLVLTSPDATTWRGTLAPAALRAVTFFNNTFVAAADDGSILTSPDAGTWTIHPTGNTHTLTALAANGPMLVAVGFGGTILRASTAKSAPTIVASPTNLTEAAGNHVLLTVTATGTAPLSYQWSFAGRPIPGATGDTLPLRSVSSAHAGPYVVTVTNALGSVTSPAATLTVLANFPAPTDIVDPTFTPSGQGSPTALALQPDGKILLANATALSRLLPGGALDPTFTSQPLTGLTLNALAVQTDRKILAGGTAGGTVLFLARFAASGAPDATFAPPATLPGQTIAQLVVQPDGKILVANNTSRPLRLNPDGSLDATFTGADLALLLNDPTVSLGIQRIALTPDGRIVVAASPAFTNGLGFYPPSTDTAVVARLRSDGSLDPTFTPVLSTSNQMQFLSVLPDGRTLLGSQYVSGNFGSGTWMIQRLNLDGSNDPTFLTQTGYIPKYGGGMHAGLDALGRIVVVITFNNFSPFLTVLRLQPDGTLDLTLRGSGNYSGVFSALKAIVVQPDSRTLISKDSNTFLRLVGTNAVPINPPIALDDSTPPTLTVTSGGDATLSTAVAGTGAFTYSWSGYFADRTYQSPYLPTSDTVTFSNLRLDAAISVTVTNAAGSLTYPVQLVHVPAAAPAITRPPADLAVGPGRGAEITFSTVGSGPLAYQWFFNGAPYSSGVITPSNASTTPYIAAIQAGALEIPAVTSATAGTYTLVLTNPLGTQTAAVTVSLDPASRLIDISTRGLAGAGDRTLIAGFVIAGDTPKWVLVRGVGPGLAQFGLTDFLPDPILTLFDSTGAPIDTNDNWIGTAESYTSLNWPATFPLTVGSLDAIISRQLAPGNYTVQLTGAGTSTGLALVEVYEGIHDSPRLVNLSSRVFVGTGVQIAISGVVVSGSSAKKLLVRAAGPALAAFGVSGTLAHPVLTLVDGTGAAVAGNAGWSTNANPAEVAAAAAKVGAFPFAAASPDAALLVTVPPGSYSALVSGANNTTGVALIEVYEVP